MTGTGFEKQVLAAILDAAVDAIIVADDGGMILQANPVAHLLFGYDSGYLVGKNVRILMPQPMSGEHDSYMKHYLRTGERKVIGIGREVTGIRKNGDVFPLHLSVGEASVDETLVFVAILHDRTRSLANEKALARSMRLEAIGQMTGGIAHDFNNFLTVIIGNLELAALRSSDAKLVEYLHNAMDAAETGASLTSRLMIFAGQGTLHPEVTDIRRTCQHTLALVRRTLGEAYKIDAECPKNLSKVMVDPVQLESALINLALNARDAMPNGGQLLFQVSEIDIDDSYMAQETDVAPGQYVRILVSDNGQGMSLETQRRAFEPFFTTKADRNGTGLGLAMVHGFVRQSGGHITLYSEPGHGTSFGLYFPALAGKTGNTQPSNTTDAALPRGNGECVLVVEDNPKVRKISVGRLHALNYETIEVENAEQAIEILKENSGIDVVFSDIVMPGPMMGFDLAEWVAAEFPAIKILLTSGYASDIATGKMRSSGKYRLLHKPYHQHELADRLSSLLGKAPG